MPLQPKGYVARRSQTSDPDSIGLAPQRIDVLFARERDRRAGAAEAAQAPAAGSQKLAAGVMLAPQVTSWAIKPAPRRRWSASALSNLIAAGGAGSAAGR